MTVIIDGSQLTIQVASIGNIDVQSDIYSEWKKWVALGQNAKYPKAFDTVGGDAIGPGQEVAPYFFCRNDLGWRIQSPNQSGEVVVEGNLFARDTSVPLFQYSPGFDNTFRLVVSSRAIVVEGSGGGGSLTPEQDALLRLIPALL
jgi:hypothetical protein